MDLGLHQPAIWITDVRRPRTAVCTVPLAGLARLDLDTVLAERPQQVLELPPRIHVARPNEEAQVFATDLDVVIERAEEFQNELAENWSRHGRTRTDRYVRTLERGQRLTRLRKTGHI